MPKDYITARGILIAQLVKNLPAMQGPWFDSWVRKIPWSRDRLPTLVFLGFLCGSTGKESACNAGDLGSILGLGRSPGKGKGYPLQYSGLENSTDYTLHGVTESDKTEQLSLSGFHFHKECTLLKRNYSGKQNNHSDLTIDDFPGHSLFLFF